MDGQSECLAREQANLQTFNNCSFNKRRYFSKSYRANHWHKSGICSQRRIQYVSGHFLTLKFFIANLIFRHISELWQNCGVIPVVYFVNSPSEKRYYQNVIKTRYLTSSLRSEPQIIFGSNKVWDWSASIIKTRNLCSIRETKKMKVFEINFHYH